ncbi:MAG: hypothetical protein ABIH00_10975, partial [Armatimonadota bacterium]
MFKVKTKLDLIFWICIILAIVTYIYSSHVVLLPYLFVLAAFVFAGISLFDKRSFIKDKALSVRGLKENEREVLVEKEGEITKEFWKIIIFIPCFYILIYFL